MGYLPDATIAAFKGFYNLGLFFRLDTTPSINLWYGVSDILAVIADVDAGGTIYLGAGQIVDMPDAIEVLINGTADRADWIMSGVDPTLTANLATSSPGIKVTGAMTPDMTGTYLIAGTLHGRNYYQGPSGYIWYINGGGYWILSPTLGTQANDFYHAGTGTTPPSGGGYTAQFGATGSASLAAVTIWPSVVGKRATFGIAALDERWQMLSDIIPMWEGTADFWAETQPVQADPTKPKTRTLTLATMTGDASRALGFYATWTDRIQKIISATDRFCERTPRYYQGQLIQWPI